MHFTVSRHFEQEQFRQAQENSVVHFEQQFEMLKSNIERLKTVIDRMSTDDEDEGEITIPNISSNHNTEVKSTN